MCAFRPYAGVRKKISLNFEEEAPESPIHADESLLRRMILNLLDNAIKYTSEAGRVSVTCRRAGEEYVLSITDTGGGIPADLQPRIFERFFALIKPVPGRKTMEAAQDWAYPFPAGSRRPTTGVWS